MDPASPKTSANNATNPYLGCKELAMGLRDNKTLRALSVGLNDISQRAGEELQRALIYGHKRSLLSGIDFFI